MDYRGSTYAEAASTIGKSNVASSQRAVPSTPLDGLDDLTNDVERIGSQIESFIARFNGGGVAAQATDAPRQTGHRAALARLTDAINRADKLARDLQTIG